MFEGVDISSIVAAFSALATAFIGLKANKVMNAAKAKKESFQADSILADNYERFTLKLEKQVKELEDKQKELTVENSTLKIQVEKLRNRIILHESANMSLPLPMWLKDTKGIMLVLNSEYESTFLAPNNKRMSDYIGKTDVEMWGEKIGKQYYAHDLKVLQTKQVWQGKETVSIQGHEKYWNIIKYPRFVGKTIIGIGGIAIPTNTKDY